MSTLPVASRWSDEFLDPMRFVGDPETDDLVADQFRSSTPSQLQELKMLLARWEAPITPDIPPAVREFLERPVIFPEWVDQQKLNLASATFHSYGALTSTLILLAGFPHTLTNPTEARAFFLAQVFNPATIRQRMFQLPHFMISVTAAGGLAQIADSQQPSANRKGPGITAAQRLRLIHSIVRWQLQLPKKKVEYNWDVDRWGRPLNQEDLMSAILNLCLFPAQGLRKLGVTLTAEEDAARLHLWKTIGFLLGVREEMQPVNLDEANLLHATIRRRRTSRSDEGVAVMRELLNVMRDMLPRWYKSLPAGLVRYHLDQETAEMLEVPEPRLLLGCLNILGKVFARERVFARVAKLISPSLIRWLSTHQIDCQRGAVPVPETFR